MTWLNFDHLNQTIKNSLPAKKMKLPQMIFFSKKTTNKIFMHLLAPFILQNFKKFFRADTEKLKKKFFQQIQSCEDAQFLGPKWPICPNENFFRKPVNEPCFFHSCLSTCQKSKSDINLLVKYWRLKNTEISLAESHFWL